MLRMFYGVKYKDVNSIKLFKREILEHFPLESQTAFVDAELCIRAHKAGFSVVELAIEHLPRLSQGASGGKLPEDAAHYPEFVLDDKMRGVVWKS